MWRYVPFWLFLLFAAGLTVFLYVEEPKQQTLLGTEVPPLKLPMFQEPPRAAADAPVTVYNLFASWCTPCIAELPLLEQLNRESVTVIGIAWKDDPQTLQDWLKRHGNPYDAIYLDNEGRYGMSLGMRGVPESFIVDAQGVIRYHHAGALTQPQLPEWQAVIKKWQQANDG